MKSCTRHYRSAFLLSTTMRAAIPNFIRVGVRSTVRAEQVLAIVEAVTASSGDSVENGDGAFTLATIPA